MFRNLKYLVSKRTISFENNEDETITLKYPLYVRVLLSVVAGYLGMTAAMTQVSPPTAMSQNRSFCAHFALFVQFISCRIDNNQVFHSEADTFSL